MNREELREQVQAAANRFTDELVEYFGEMLQSVIKDVTLGVAEAKPLRKAAPPAPRPAPKNKVVNQVAPNRAAPKKNDGKAPEAKKAKPEPKKAKPEPNKGRAVPAKAKVAPKGKTAPKPNAAPAASAKSNRRSNKELDQVAERVVKLLKDEGKSMRIEEINKRLNTSTSELMRPIKKLLGNNRIQRRGERRSTTYFA